MSYERQFLGPDESGSLLHGEPDVQHLARLRRESRPSTSLATARPDSTRRDRRRAACSNTSAANRQARSLLSMINPVEGAYYLVNGVAQTYDKGTGSYHGVKFAVQKRMSNGWSLSANYTRSRCISQGEPGTDIGNTFPVPLIDPINNPQPDPTTNEGPVRGGSSAQLQSVVDSRRARASAAVRQDADQGLADRPDLSGPQRDRADAVDHRRHGAHRPAAAADDRRRRRSESVGGRAVLGEPDGPSMVQHGGVRAEPRRRLGRSAAGLPARARLLERRPGVLTQRQLRHGPARSRCASRRSTSSTP